MGVRVQLRNLITVDPSRKEKISQTLETLRIF